MLIGLMRLSAMRGAAVDRMPRIIVAAIAVRTIAGSKDIILMPPTPAPVMAVKDVIRILSATSININAHTYVSRLGLQASPPH